MKKFLVLAAVFALAFSMGPVSDAFAEATVYGTIHASIDYVDGDGAPTSQYEDPNLTVASNATRIGFKGSERLDNGMDLIWQLESQINLDGEGYVPAAGDESTGLIARNRFIGVKGGFGTLMVGIHDTPFKEVGRKVDLFPDRVGDARNITDVGDWDLREKNIIGYKNKFGPVDLFLLYSTDTEHDDTIDYHGNSLYSVGVTWKGGPVMIAGAFEKHHEPAGTPSEEALRASGSFELSDDFKLVGFLQKIEDQGGASGADRDTFGVGAAFTAGNITLKAQAYMADDLGAAADTGAKLITIGAETKLDKNVTVYAVLSKVDNDGGNSTFIVNGSDDHGDPLDGVNNGDSPSALSFGIVYDF